MGRSTDYSDVPEWVFKPEGYDPIRDKREIKVKYQGNIFKAKYWAGKEPGVDPGWELYDELYDVTSHAATKQAKVIAYIPSWKKQSGFNYAGDEMYRYITHGIIAFLMFDEKNLGEFTSQSVKDVDAIATDVVTAGHRNGVKISIALGGATDYGFLNLMTAVGNNPVDPRLDRAVQNVINFVQSNNLDGVDLDLECWWDKNGDPHNDQGGKIDPHPAGYGLTAFARKLRAAMPNKLISAAFFASSWYGNNYQLIEYVDWIGVMTYDLTGSWNNSPVGPHSALDKIRDQKVYEAEQQGSWSLPNPESPSKDPMRDNPIQSVEEALWYWTNPFYVNWQGAGQRMPRSKFVGGVPLYGYDFAYPKDLDTQSNQVPPGYKTITYKDILAQFPGASTAGNGNIKVPGSRPRPPFISASGNYPYANNIYFETPNTSITKLNFLKSVGAQGVIIWELTTDVWEEGKSIVKALYKNSGNLAKEQIFEPRPFYIIGHNPNTIAEVIAALDAGANAIEPDVNVHKSNPNQICIHHGPLLGTGAGDDDAPSLIQFLKDLHQVAIDRPQLSLVVFDCKPLVATPEHGKTLLDAIRQYLTFDTNLNVIISVATFDDKSIFDKIHNQLGSREGLMIDSENDPVAVSDFFINNQIDHQCYGNGISIPKLGLGPRPPGPNDTLAPNVRPSMENACELRAANNRFKFIYVWTVNGDSLAREFIQIGVDGIITDEISTIRSIVQEEHYHSVLRIAQRNDNPFLAANLAYGLTIYTGDVPMAGTDANITFTLTGTKNSRIVTIDTSLPRRMERGATNYITLQSPDLGDLLSITLQRDNQGVAPGWYLDRITVESFRHLGINVQKTATFNRWIDTTSPFTQVLQ